MRRERIAGALNVPRACRLCAAVLAACMSGIVCGIASASPAPAIPASETTAGMTQSAGAQLEATQHQLQALLGELDKALPPASVNGFHANQRQWSALAKRECTWERNLSGGGSMAPMVYANCLEERTRQRIDWLKIFLCEGYGSTGECDASKRY